MYIIFDTNVYREITYGMNEAEARLLIDSIKRAEAVRGITPALSLVTVMELMMHLADKNDPAYENCRMALIAAGYHALRADNVLSYFPHPQLQLQQLIFETYNEETALKFEIIMEIVNFLNKGPADQYIQQFDEQLQEVKRMVVQHEADFKATMLSVIKGIDPETTTWTALEHDKEKRRRVLDYFNKSQVEVLDLLAMGYVTKTMRGIGKQLSLNKMALAAIDVVTYFRTALRLHLEIMKKMLIGGFDMDNAKKNRENTIWDIYQLFTITDSTVNEKEVVFVTGDEWLHTVSRESGLEPKIIRKNQYFEMLDLNH